MAARPQETFRAWVSKQAIMGSPMRFQDRYHASCRVDDVATAYVCLMPHELGEVVELSVWRPCATRPSFLTHFILGDEQRARALFCEMTHACESMAKRGAQKIMVCYPHAAMQEMRHEAFVDRLQREADKLSVAYKIVPATVGQALKSAEDCAAIVLMPEARAFQQQLHRAHRSAAVFTLPSSMAERMDARMAMRLLLEVMGEIDTLSPAAPPVPSMRALARPKNVLLINIMYCDRLVRMGWCVYNGVNEVAAGKVCKALLSLQDVYDLVDTLFLYGVEQRELAGIEFLVPGIVNFCSSNLASLGERDEGLLQTIREHVGIPAFMDNNTNAAAMGCYMVQDTYENVTVLRHQLGHRNAGQGSVVGGKVVAGRFGLAGEPKFYQARFSYGRPYSELVWSEQGLATICKNVALATIATIEPDALYLAVSTLDDLGPLRTELEHSLPAYCWPEIFSINDYRARMYLGGSVLCHQHLEDEDA